MSSPNVYVNICMYVLNTRQVGTDILINYKHAFQPPIIKIVFLNAGFPVRRYYSGGQM